MSALMSKIGLLFVCLLPLTSFNLQAETLTMVSWEIPGWVDGQGQGAMIDVVNEVVRRTDLDIDVRVYPPKRAIHLFKRREVIGMFPAVTANVTSPAHISDPFVTKRIYGLSVQGMPPIETLDDLKGKVIGLAAGFSYPPQISTNDQFLKVQIPKIEDALKLVQMKRIDLFLEEKHTLDKVTARAGQQAELKIVPIPVLAMEAGFAFQKSKQGAQIEKAFSAAIQAMKADGSLEKILAVTR